MGTDKRHKLRTFVRCDNTGKVVAGSLIYATEQPKVGIWHEIASQWPWGTTPSSNYTLTLAFDDIANANLMVGDASSVTDWNTFFDLPAYGNSFTSVTVVGNSVELKGGSNITIKPYLFGNSPQGLSLLEIVDTGCVIGCSDGVFSDYGWGYPPGCYSLTKAHLPSCVYLGSWAFADCEALSDLVIPFDSYTSLGTGIFTYCKSLTGTFSFPNLVVAQSNCFSHCDGITSFDLPSLTTIGDNVFQDCILATSFNIPLIDYLMPYTFAGCISLVSTDDITMGNIDVIPANCFEGCEALTTVNLPLVGQIDDAAFANCTSLVNIDFPIVNYIGFQAFYICSAMIEFDMPLLTTLLNGSFAECISATTFNLPALVNVGDYAFLNCTAATTFTLTSVGVLGQEAFKNCQSVTTLSLPACTTTKDSVFADCTALISLSVPMCTKLGTSIENNLVFDGIVGNTISLTIPAILMTCYSGNPDGDIVLLQANNTVNITTV